MINEGHHWDDLTRQKLPEFFKSLTNKFEQVTHKLITIENEKEKLAIDLKQSKAQLEDYSEDISAAKAEKKKSQLMQKDYEKM